MQHLSRLPVRYFTGNLNNRIAIHSAATVQHCTLLQHKKKHLNAGEEKNEYRKSRSFSVFSF
jgi:hypothetical protein